MLRPHTTEGVLADVYYPCKFVKILKSKSGDWKKRVACLLPEMTVTTSPVLCASCIVLFKGNLYASVDVRYSDTKDIVTCATGRIMLVEIAMNLIAVYLS
ncbi:unnamed protein product [Strongylus vulgaris]|uniref:Uncharacterized protein n=1 Tax=Strongylus vulgaris TaxID=40348 RepID=A0A3P7IV64_STRVU|nr:unnamed protein product [Strongylus vulgaris]